MEIVAGGHSIVHLQAASLPVAQHLDEGGEEVRHAVSKLLHVGVLVGGALVAVDGDTLVHHGAVQVLLLAQRLHHQLLQVTAEQGETVLVRQDHHVPSALASAGLVPGQREQRRWVSQRLAPAGQFIHRRRSGKHLSDANALQRRREQAHGAQNRGATADPVPHREAVQKAPLLREAMEPAALAGDGDRVPAEVEAQRFVGRRRLEHAVTGLRRPSGLGDHHRQRGTEVLSQRQQRAIDAVGVGVVQEMRLDTVTWTAQGVGNELRAQGGAADSDHQQPVESVRRRRPDLPLVHA